MRYVALSGVARYCRGEKLFSFAMLLLAFGALAFFNAQAKAVAQDSKSPSVLPAPSEGKAIVCIYRVGRITGASSHDELYVNGVHLAKLISDEYAFTQVSPGTVVIVGLPKMYYGGIITSAGAAVNQSTQKEHERARFEAEAGKTYYLKWTAGAMATGIKVTPQDPIVGAKEMSKLHLAKPPEDDKEKEKQDSK